LSRIWNINPLCSATVADLAKLDINNLHAANSDLRDALDGRREQLRGLRQRRNEVDRAEQEQATKVQVCDERAGEAESAWRGGAAGDGVVEQKGCVLVNAWQRYFEGLQQLIVSDSQPVLEELADWVLSLLDDNPARLILQRAMQDASQRLARRHAE